MDSFLYDDIENDQKNIRRLATIEGSINRTLLYDEEKNQTSCKNTYGCLTYILSVLIIFMVIIVILIVIKYLM